MKTFTKVLLSLILFLLVLAANAGAGLYYFSDEFISSFTLTGAPERMTVGDTANLSTTLEYSIPMPFPEAEVTFSSSNPEVLSVDQNGNLTALDEGDVSITASVSGGTIFQQRDISVYFTGKIVPSISGITLGVGEEFSITAEVSGESSEKEIEELTFTSDNPEIAEIDDVGGIVAKGVGTAVISAEAPGYVSGEVTVIVKKAPTSLVSLIEKPTMGLGETASLPFSAGEDESCLEVVFSTSNKKVITVSEDGKSLTAVGGGNCEITMTAYNGISKKVLVTVRAEPTSVRLNQSLTGFAGRPVKLSYSAGGGGCLAFTFQSSDPAVASVDELGYVTPLKKGQAVLSCTSYNGKTATCEVTVQIVDYNRLYIADKVYADVAALCAAYPDMITMESIGESELGREIIMMKVGKGDRKVFVGAEMHAAENVTVNFVMRCIEEYVDAYYDSGKYSTYDIKKMLDEITLYVVPMINPDGLEILNNEQLPSWVNGDEDTLQNRYPQRHWRENYMNNDNGVNLNRNFPFRWEVSHGDGAKDGPNEDRYVGEYEGSEAETKALVALCNANEFEFMFSFHVFGNFVYWRDNVNGEIPGAFHLAKRLQFNCGMGLMPSSSASNLGGGFENWFRQEFSRPGFCIELIAKDADGKAVRFIRDDNFESIVIWDKTRYIITEGLKWCLLGNPDSEYKGYD